MGKTIQDGLLLTLLIADSASLSLKRFVVWFFEMGIFEENFGKQSHMFCELRLLFEDVFNEEIQKLKIRNEITFLFLSSWK